MRLIRSLPLLLLASCAGPPGGSDSTPLLDPLHAPEVLVESPRIELPPAYGANRFLTGWWTWRRRGEVWLVPEPSGARLELVHLEPRERTLILRTEVFKTSPEERVRVLAGEREIGTLPLTAPLEVPLPGDLPPGRVGLTLHFPEEAQVALDAAGFAATRPAGEVLFEEGTIVQAPTSAIDFVRPAGSARLLRGRFQPPESPTAGQRFGLLVERRGRFEEAFAWRPGWRGRLPGAGRFSLPLPDGGEWLRIRLVAGGEGPAGRWSDLRLEGSLGRGPDGARPDAAGESASAAPPLPRLVVLYVFDALRADAVGHLGGPEAASPVVDRLAAEGVTFADHLSVAPNTLPSTKSLFTGQAFVHRGHAKLSASGPATLAEIFTGAGYRTAAFSGNGYIGPAYGTDRGFQHLAPEVVFREYADRPGTYNDNAERVHRSALGWLDGLAPGERAFVYLHTIHPHNPYDPPEPFRGRFTGGVESDLEAATQLLLDVKHHRVEVDAADRRRIAGLYAGAFAYNDAQLALLVEELKRRFPPREILLILTSDHGEELFDHGGVLHGYTLYREQLHIPLVLWWPQILEPRRVEAATDNLDLHETLRALVGAPPSGLGDGRSLWPLARGSGAGKPVRFAAASSVKGGIFLARSPRLKLIQAPRTGLDWGMGEGLGRSRDPEYLFDLAADPEERTNLAGRQSPEAAWLRARLEAWVAAGRDLEAGAGEEAEIDDETARRLRALGYLE